jgi:hypothetical protein
LTLDWRERDAQLLPDSRRWGRGYGGKPYTSKELEETRDYIMGGKDLPGYENRGLVHRAPGFFQDTDGSFRIPPGFDAEHPARSQAPSSLLVEPNNPTSLDCIWRVPGYLEEFYRDSGADVDQHGRWIHPLSLQVMEADIPICTGYGGGYEGGEMVNVNIVVEDVYNFLFNKRQDGGHTIYSLVGGITWATDFTTIENWRVGNRPISYKGILNATRRIVHSKAGIKLPAGAVIQIAWGSRPWRSIHTLHFGIVTYTVHVRLAPGTSDYLDKPSNGSWWCPQRDLPSVVDRLLPDHRRGFDACREE